MGKGTGWDWPPAPVEEWRQFATTAELAEELDLCGVPLDSTPLDACRLLELNGSWATRQAVVKAQARRKGLVSEMA